MANVKETHHFYPVLFYFRFRDAYYSVSQVTLVSLDAVSLIKSALDDERYGWLKESAAVTQLWRTSLILATTLERAFLPGDVPGSDDQPDARARDRWRRRYFAALRRLRQSGIQTIADEEAGAEAYAALRAEWDPHITALAPAMAYTMDEIDRVGSDPESSDERPEFRTGLRSVG